MQRIDITLQQALAVGFAWVGADNPTFKIGDTLSLQRHGGDERLFVTIQSQADIDAISKRPQRIIVEVLPPNADARFPYLPGSIFSGGPFRFVREMPSTPSMRELTEIWKTSHGCEPGLRAVLASCGIEPCS